MASALQTGHVDLAFGAYPTLLSGINEQTLYEERYYCFARPGHPFLAEPSLETFLPSTHILVSTRGLAHAPRDVESELTDRLPPESIRVPTGSFMFPLAAAARSVLSLNYPAQEIDHTATPLDWNRRGAG